MWVTWTSLSHLFLQDCWVYLILIHLYNKKGDFKKHNFRREGLSPCHEIGIAIYYVIGIEICSHINKWYISALKLRVSVIGATKSTVNIILMTCVARLALVFLCSDFYSFLAMGRGVASFCVPTCPHISSSFHICIRLALDLLLPVFNVDTLSGKSLNFYP